MFAALDPRHKVDLRDEPQEVTAKRMLQFLQLLKHSFPTQDLELYGMHLVQGDRSVIYPILFFILSKREQLTKRAYLARFLVNIEVPAAFLHDEAVKEVHSQYKQLQRDFKATHKTVDRLRNNTLSPAELKREIKQLEDEKAQLKDKIKDLKRKTTNEEGFAELLKVTSALRKEQEEETKLQERMREQRAALQNAERRYADATRKLAEMRAAASDDVSGDEMVRRLRKMLRESTVLCDQELPREIQERKSKMRKLGTLLMEPAKSEQDLADLQMEVRSTQNDIEDLKAKIERAMPHGGSGIQAYRQQSLMVAKKLQKAEDDLEKAANESDMLESELGAKQQQLADLSGDAKYMKKGEFKEYSSNLRAKTSDYRTMKQELASLQNETVVLNRTEQVLRSRAKNVDEVLRKLEARRGAAGFSATQDHLEKVSASTAHLNQTKGKTLEQISMVVTDINQQLKLRKNKLAPQIKDLRSVRQKYQELEQGYLEKKAIYENTAVGLESERLKLEAECNAYQDECLREESRYHYLSSLIAIAQGHLDRVQQEVSFERGEKKFMRDWKCYKDMYQNKIQQQEQLSKELRKRQKLIKESAGGNAEQRAMFVDLRVLLNVKARTLKKSLADPSKRADDNMFDLGQDIGGANVMTIEQGS